MKLLPVLTLAIAAGVVGPAFANADLAQKKLCTTCHAVDKKLVSATNGRR